MLHLLLRRIDGVESNKCFLDQRWKQLNCQYLCGQTQLGRRADQKFQYINKFWIGTRENYWCPLRFQGHFEFGQAEDLHIFQHSGHHSMPLHLGPKRLLTGYWKILTRGFRHRRTSGCHKTYKRDRAN